MRRIVFLGVVLVMTAAVVGFSMAANEAAKVAPIVDGADSASGGCPSAGGCEAAKEGCPASEGCPVAAASCAAGGCAATACSAEKGCSEEKPCCAKKKVALVCPVSGDPADKTIFAKFKGGKVYLRCNGCKAKFEKEVKKFATKANLQLASTGQFVQKGCPFSGGKVNKETEISLCDVKVGFCGKGCQEKVAKAEPDKQLKMIFSNKAFKKAFALKKEPAKKKEQVEEKKAG